MKYPTASAAQGGGGVRPNRGPQPSKGTGSGSTSAKGVMGGGDTTQHKGTMGDGKSTHGCKGVI